MAHQQRHGWQVDEGVGGNPGEDPLDDQRKLDRELDELRQERKEEIVIIM